MTDADCTRFQDSLFDYLDGALDRLELGTFRLHYSACAECSELLRSVEGQAALLMALPRPVPPRDLGTRIESAIDDRIRMNQPPAAFGRWIAVAAAAILAVAGLFQLAAPAATSPAPERVVRVIDVAPPDAATIMGRLAPSYENPGASLLDPLVDRR